MKVAFISQPIDYVAPRGQGISLVLWTRQVIRALQSERGSSFTIYARQAAGQPRSESVDGIQYRRFSVRLDEIGAKPFKLAERLLGYPWKKRPFFASPLSYAGYAWQVAAALRRDPVDVVHIHNFSQLAAPIRALNPRVKIVLHMHCEWLSQLDRGMIDRRLRHVDLILGCSEYITEKVRLRFPQHAARCQTVYNGVDAQRFQPAPVAPAKSGPAKIVYVGRISPEKGVHNLLAAYALAAREFPQAQLEIIGAPGAAPYEYIAGLSDDPDAAEIAGFYHGLQRRSDYMAALQAELPAGLAGSVRFTGPLENEALVEHYRSAALLVNPSLSEAFGMSLIEAMACEVPVVATRIGGMQEVVSDGVTGLFTAPHNPQDLAAAMLRLLKNPDMRRTMGAAGRQKVLQHFTWDQVAAHLWDLYSQLDAQPLRQTAPRYA